jgi:hypothetical protein
MTTLQHAQDLLSAYHEAAHAVVAADMGFVPHQVEIFPRPKPTPDGRLRRAGTSYLLPEHERLPRKEQVGFWQARIVTALAGDAAERKLVGDNEPSSSADHDMRTAWDHSLQLAKLLPDNPALNIARAISDVRHLQTIAEDSVSRHWDSISSIAHDLVQHRKLAGDELLERLTP